jgi:outer membrane protein TolC
VLRSDVLSLEVRLAEAEETAIRAENTRKLAMARLATLLGEGAGTELEVVDAEWEDTTLPEGYGDALAEALAARPELARARASVERAALGLSAAKRAFLPSVDAEARAYWDDADLEYRGDRTNWFLGVSLNWTLFEGGRRRAALERAGAFYRELLGADRKQVLAIESEVRSATLRLAEARARVRVTQASEAQAEEGLELVRKQYEGGAAGITRYLEAELALTRSRVRRASATIDLGKARAELARAIGRFAPARANHER